MYIYSKLWTLIQGRGFLSNVQSFVTFPVLEGLFLISSSGLLTHNVKLHGIDTYTDLTETLCANKHRTTYDTDSKKKQNTDEDSLCMVNKEKQAVK